MLLTITTTHEPATDLGYLLHKNPAGIHERDLAFGTARVVYPEAEDTRCTAALIIDVDSVELVRRRPRNAPKGDGFSLAQYVNDRPYAASSFLSVAISRMFGTAMTGRSKERPELAETALPFSVHLPVVPCRGGEDLLRRVFEPLGYEVAAQRLLLDPVFPEWGDSRYFDVTLGATVTTRELLEHLFVFLPVLDDDKHYWVGDEEVEKLLRRGGAWLAQHPERDLITRRYLRYDRRLTRDALARLMEVDDAAADPDAEGVTHDAEEAEVERPISLNEQRMDAVVQALRDASVRTAVDLGCGEGKLVRRLLREPGIERIVGVDVSWRALEFAARRLRLHEMPPRQRERVELRQGALTYRDRNLAGFDAATVVEVIEHLDPPRLRAFEQVVFVHARPRVVAVTTPNVEYNVRFEGLPAGSFRHRDHRFEWTREEFGDWATRVADQHSYRLELVPIGPVDGEVGSPTQMAVFTR
jgi:3' terminal RNA ribose 2'-O-methyltransferase Hen1